MNKILLITFGAVAVLTATVGAYDTSCGNPWDNDSGDGNCKDDSKVGTNPINAQRACLIRRVTDIQTYGAAPIEFTDRKSTRLNSSHIQKSRMPSSA